MTGEGLFGSSPGVLLLVQGTLCIGTGLAASYRFRHRTARAHQVLVVGLLMSVILPCLTLLVNHLDLGLFVSQAPAPLHEMVTTLGPAEAVTGDLPGPEMDSTAVLTVAEPAPIAGAVQEPTATHLPWETVLGVCWIVATAVLLGRIVLRFILGLLLVRTSDELKHEALCRAADTAKARLGIRCSVHVRSSMRVSSPILWGWTSEPVVLVPKDAEQHAASEDWVGIFCHEFAHWKRLDHLSSLFAEIMVCAVPWHPLMWWARARLLRLSEQVCDDWVLACGQAGVNYAESLLDLSPQRPITLLPAIVGKGHTMKERIRRIVKEECGNPRVGRPWTLGVGTVTAIIAVGAAFAQPRPAGPESRRPPQPGALQVQERQDLVVAGRRNVLKRLIEQLRDQARETEKALAEHPEAMGEETQILRSERAALQEQIQIVERQLRNLDRDPRMPQPIEDQMARQASEKAARLQELRRLAEEIQNRLQRSGDKEGSEAGALQESLNQVREKIAATEREMQQIRRRPEAFEQERLQADRGRRDVTGPQQREVVTPGAVRRMPGEPLRPEAEASSPRDARMGRVVMPDRIQGLQAQVEDLHGQVKGLHEQMQQMQRLLEQLLQQRPEGNQMQGILEQLLRQRPEDNAKPNPADRQP